MSKTDDILTEIANERQSQIDRWGNDVDDKHNMPNDWVSYISRYSTAWFPGKFPPYDTTTYDAFRTSMIKTAALAVAAIEWIDRRRDE